MDIAEMNDMPFNPRWRARMDWREEGAFHNPYPTYTPEYDAYEYEAWIISMDHDNPARP